ncbi:MAG: hypothetical protein O7B25_07200 [Gammaproteobacteria bacterium]|nr:hypothetical protein [Gammaproteobacteria bacterium]
MQFREKARATLVLYLVVASTLAAITGCQARPESPEPEPDATASTDPVDTEEIFVLLDAAEAAMQREQLTYPAQGSALGLYDTVLAMDPHNEHAQRGLERIVEYYLEKAELAAQRNHPARARSMLERARIVDADHPAVHRTEIQINLLANATRKRLTLDTTQLARRSADLSAPLKTFGTQARAANCRAIIRVRNDAEGRWVYQQMNSAPGEDRIRAQIQIGSPPLVELVCFHDG